MSLRKWIYILLFAGIILIGIPTAANSDEETDPSSVKECRVHIEKALEQYWDKKEPNERTYVKRNRNLASLKDIGESYDKSRENSIEDIEDDNDEDESIEELNDIKTENQNKDSQSKVKNEEIDDDDDEDEDDEEYEGDDEDDEDEDDDEQPDIKSSANDSPSKEIETEEDDENESEIDDEDDDEDDEDDDDDDDQQSSSVQNVTKINTESVKDTSQGDRLTSSVEDEEDDDEDEDDDDDEDDESSKADAEEEEDDEEEDEEDDDDEDTEDEEDDDEDQVAEEKSYEKATIRVNYSSKITDSLNKTGILTDDIASKEVKKEDKQVPFAADKAEAKVLPEFSQRKENVSDSIESESKKGLEEDEPETETMDEIDEEDDDTIENIYEEDEDEGSTVKLRSREHVDAILDLDSEAEEIKREEAKLARSIFNEIKKIETQSIRPMELLYKYADSTSRSLGDAELFNKPMLLFLGPWNSGKTTVINYILGIENTPHALKTGTGITGTDFTIIDSGDRNRVVSGTELAADWRYAGTQKFGQGFLDHFRSIHIQNPLLDKVILVDTPGILENRKNTERGYPLNDVFQWFIDRADAIYVVLDPMKVDIGAELGSVIEELKGRDTRFILNKADSIRRSDLMRVVGQLFWNLSPLMSSTEAPIIYAVSLTSKPYHPSAPAKFLTDQEKNFFYDMKTTLEKHVENKILYARKHAVRVRNHAKMVDCFLATYYRHKSIFSNKRNVAKLITENPTDYNIFDGFGSVTNVSRFDLPNPQNYKEFFKIHPLYDFKPLASTCSYFRGCPMDKLDLAITKDIPELLGKYKKTKREIYGEPKEER